jgi:glycosyltransferase involved in cell wall biosynthesis
MASKLSVVVNTYNEAKILPQALTSVRDLVDEIVIIDMESSDNIHEIAKKFDAKVFSHKHLEYVEPARNFGTSKATGDWVLVLDPDEEVSDTLATKIKEIIKNNEADYCRIPRKNIIFNHWIEHAHWWPDYNIRLFRKGAVSWSEVIHAVPFTQGKGIDFDAKEDLAIIHHHYDSLEGYVERMNRYTSIQADRKVKSGYKFSWRDILTKPTNEFLSRYFGDKGYKDGIYGLALSLLQGFSELVLYLKIWQADKFKDEKVSLTEIINEMREKERDLHYWQGDSMYKESGDIRDRVRRKLRI